MQGPVRILSDLHLGHPGCRIGSVEALRPLIEGVGTVIFNGDTVEQRHPALAAAGARLLGDLQALLAEAGAAGIYLRGNHDPGISALDWLDLAGGRLFLTHGDALFRHLSPWSPKVWKAIPQMEAIRGEYDEADLRGSLATVLDYTHRCRSVAEGTELEFKSGRFKNLRSAARLVWPPGRPVRILGTWLTVPGRAHDFIRQHRPEARAILFGHSHFAGIWRRGGRVAVNTGGFVSVMPARFVDWSGDGLAVRRVDEADGRFMPGREVARIVLG